MSLLIDSVIPRAHPPADCVVGQDVVIHAHELTIGPGVRLDDGVQLVGDRIHLGRNVHVGAGADLRAAHLSIGENSEIAAGVKVLCADSFSTGPAARVCNGVDIVARSFGAGRLLYVGPHSTVGGGGTLESTATVRIGDRVTIGPHNLLNANCLIDIGSDVGSGQYVSIWTHGYHFAHSVLDGYSTAYEGVRIGDKVWLGYHCSIMPGADIGDSCIVAAGAVVAKSFPPRRLLAGVPAREKATFEQPPLTDDQAMYEVRQALAAWQRELVWKGAITDSSDERWSVTLSGCTRVVELWQDAAVATSSDRAAEDRIVVALDGEPQTSADGPPVFVLRRGLLLGPTDELVEDLRDYLRRRTMPCGDTRTFTSITPLAFHRLQQATTPTTSGEQA
ncbi:DapH/DapD/GlmU-related protein [Streptomyces sp. NBC_01233]|uniref:DapH/DapD/GlmU-related protein n=1 Tax=Streptomyces sp. NBC_01233 TaxID=2903787 RepID=UPI002E10365D|nr:hypothetical protein OG332_30260 [Streptomyces sp. NBC_01233]